MALLSKGSGKHSSGHIYPRLGDTVFGGRSGRINKNNELVNCDYVFVFNSNDDTDYDDIEVGINKNYSMIHDIDWNDEHKNTNHKRERKERNTYYEDAEEVFRRIRSGG